MHRLTRNKKNTVLLDTEYFENLAKLPKIQRVKNCLTVPYLLRFFFGFEGNFQEVLIYNELFGQIEPFVGFSIKLTCYHWWAHS